MLTTITDVTEWTTLCGGTLLQKGTRPVERIVLDSRENCEGALFVAIKGTHTDGHAHLTAAIKGGAAAILISVPPTSFPPDVSVICVPDTARALQDAAVKWKKNVAPTCIAVTGSVGKTTTREMLAAILQAHAPTFAAPENFNTEIGAPLSVLGMPRGTKYLICEFGMRACGEIAFLSRMLQPDMGILTCIGSSHLETLGSRQAIAEAKMELICGMQGGSLVYDGEEPLLLPLRTCNVRGVPVYRSQIIKLGVHDGSTNFSYGGMCYTVKGVGAHLLYDCTLACTAARMLGLSVKEIRDGLQGFRPAAGRQELLRLKDGITLIADYYNAAPESMEAAIHALTELANGRTLAILGGMLELGAQSALYHEALGRILAARKTSLLWCIGAEAEQIAKGARDGGMTEEQIRLLPYPYQADQLAAALLPLLRPEDTILLKASRKFRLETLVTAICARLTETE